MPVGDVPESSEAWAGRMTLQCLGADGLGRASLAGQLSQAFLSRDKKTDRGNRFESPQGSRGTLDQLYDRFVCRVSVIDAQLVQAFRYL